jgi:hypothetical protein
MAKLIGSIENDDSIIKYIIIEMISKYRNWRKYDDSSSIIVY